MGGGTRHSLFATGCVCRCTCMYDYGEGQADKVYVGTQYGLFLALRFLWEGINDPSGLSCRLTRRNDALGPDLIGRKEAYTKEGPFWRLD